MEGIKNFAVIVNTLFEMTGLFLFIQSLAPVEKKRRPVWCILLFAVIVVLVGAVNIFQYDRIILILTYVVIILFASFYYRITLKDAVLYLSLIHI